MKKIKIQMYIPDNDNHPGNTEEGTNECRKLISIMTDILGPKLMDKNRT